MEWDRSLARALHRLTAHPSVLFALVVVSWLSDGIVWYVTMLGLPLVGGADGTPCALRMLFLGGVNLMVYRICKRHFARPRPFVACPGVRACAGCVDEHSYLSGHVLHAVAFGVLLCACYPALSTVVWPFVSVVAMSRVVLGLHFPTDVLASAALGWFTATSVLLLF